MKTNEKLIKKSQELARLERKLALDKIKQRKKETRRKIELGGLIIKSGLDNFSKEIILGALIHAAKELGKEEGAQSLYQSIGKNAFLQHGGSTNDKSSKQS